MKKTITGNYASAYGAKLARAQVIPAYPITPQTSIVEKLAEFCSSGEMKAEFIKVESEHSAMAACIAAQNTGARTYTATSAHGLALMHEMLMWASGARLPIVMSNVNRAMGPPWSVWADHYDTIAQRDTGWIKFYCESNQEVLDTVIQAYKVAEDHEVLMPAMIIEDAFILSHTMESVDIPDEETVDEFLPPLNPAFKLDVDNPMGFGSLVMPVSYMEFRYKMAKGMEAAKEKIKQVDMEFEKKFGRSYGGLVEQYKCKGADVVLVCMGTIASTARDVVDKMQEEGKPVGMAKLRVFRPFPRDEIRELARSVSVLGVMDRSYSFGYGGAAYAEICGALYGAPDTNKPIVKDYILGLGGRDITPHVIEKVFENALEIKEKGLDKDVEWVDLKTKNPDETLSTGSVI